jgi:galactonate dehydratase
VLEMTRIAAMADIFGVTVAPHNPTGPVATAASIQLCAGMKNFRVLELQWGEVAWRGALVLPAEKFVNGMIAVPDLPGFGVMLNEELAREKRMV